ncbi:hypothetical protein M0R19_05875 [Candidatus Pacearchaeota archaeon]|jgi:hypothetical protein|nr:hypothetical protein [Candidatus Pacearchaeota archaeon]
MEKRSFYDRMTECEQAAKIIHSGVHIKTYWEGYIAAIQDLKKEYKIFIAEEK